MLPTSSISRSGGGGLEKESVEAWFGIEAEPRHQLRVGVPMTSVRSYARWQRKTVQGWLSRGACDMIVCVADVQQTNNVHGNIAEIGVHHGRLFILLDLLARTHEKALAIDLFEDQSRNVDRSGVGDYNKFVANIERHVGDTSRVVFHRGDSTELTGAAVRELAGGPIRLFSIDGGHTEEITKHDLETAEQAIGPGGVVILDDCFNAGWPGVVTGVARFLATDRTIRPFAIGGNKTLFAAPDYCDAYRTALSGAALGMTSERRFFSYDVLHLEFASGALMRLRQSNLWQLIKDTNQGRKLKHYCAKFQTRFGMFGE